MKIKNRIALYFTLMSTTMLMGVLAIVYFTFMKFLQADFFARLTDRTMVTAQLYLEADEISREALNSVRHQYLQKLTGEVTRIYDDKNRATFIGDSAQYWSAATIKRVRKQKHLQYIDGQQQVVGIYYEDNQGSFVILAAAIDQGSHDRLNKLLKIMVFIFLLISLTILLSSRWLAERMLKPLKKFMEQVQQIGAQNMEFRVAENENKDEINLIAKSFNHLMEELEQAFVLQRTFVANASHELRTPVTRIMMTTELALSKERSALQYQEVIHSVLEDAEKMDNIITGLLALAKMDLQLIQSQLSPISIKTVLKDIGEEWKAQKMLPLKVALPHETEKDFTVFANRLLLRIALDNIIANAFKFSNQKPVNCSLHTSESHIIIEVTDQGPGIASADLKQVFQPFFTRAETFNLKGEGMGLYMAQKIIGVFKGKIEITTKNSNGTTFIVTLPKF